MSTQSSPTNPDCEIVSSRIFPVDNVLLFRAWSEPNHLKNWWGPAGFTNTFHEFDFRIGGRWKFVMHGPDKGNYQNECEFTKIVAPSLIEWKRITQPLFNVVTQFEIVDQHQTKLIFKMVFDTPEECAKIKKFVVDKNEENFDKLEIELKKMKLS
ncbi:MAG: SRPBCC family protein [Crocinitomix sp.]|nr:SRPBCC family protein [Crocinitomix sp.]